MQKKIIAIAIAAALAPAVAMADTGNVTLYGIADVSFDSVDNGDTTAGANGVRVSKVSSNSSRLGFKGNEDLGGGLKAVWQMETTVNVDAATATSLGDRPTFAGLAGDSWGQVTMGRHESSYKTSTRAMDAFGDHIADNRALMGTTGFTAGTGTNVTTNVFDSRNSNSIRYDSPNFSGFKVSGLYGINSETNVNASANYKAKTVSLSGNYSVAPFSAALAYQKNDISATSDNKAWKGAVGYQTSQFAVNGIYEKTSDNLGAGAGGTGHKAFYLAGKFNATANDAIKLAFAKAKEQQDGSAANTGAKQWSLGVDHSMSKRTTVYAMYTKLDNESSAGYSLASSASTGTTANLGTGADQTAFSLGMKHVF